MHWERWQFEDALIAERGSFSLCSPLVKCVFVPEPLVKRTFLYLSLLWNACFCTWVSSKMNIFVLEPLVKWTFLYLSLVWNLRFCTWASCEMNIFVLEPLVKRRFLYLSLSWNARFCTWASCEMHDFVPESLSGRDTTGERCSGDRELSLQGPQRATVRCDCLWRKGQKNRHGRRQRLFSLFTGASTESEMEARWPHPSY